MFGTGDQAAEEARFSGTHTGALRTPNGDVPPTGKRMASRYAAVSRVKNGKVTSFHVYFDVADVLAQLGLMPWPVTIRRLLGGRGHKPPEFGTSAAPGNRNRAQMRDDFWVRLIRRLIRRHVGPNGSGAGGARRPGLPPDSRLG